ncbi:MAG: hypothetical protein AAGE65_01110 [Planctomycetota bacterium]
MPPRDDISPPEPPPAPDQAPAFDLPDPPDADEVNVADEVNATLNLLLPWGISLLLHAGAVLLAVFAVWTVVIATTDEETVIPELELSATPDAPLVQQTQVREISTPEPQQAPTPTPTPQPTPTETIDLSTQLVGLAGPSSSVPFGATISGPQLQANFMGSRGGNAKRIVFLIESGGSIVDTLPFVLEELKSSIRKLAEQQRFTVIFYAEHYGRSGFIEVPPNNLQPATAQHKQRVITWMDLDQRHIYAGGKSNVIPALQRALSYRPQLIFWLTDNPLGEGAFLIDRDRLLDSIEDTNRNNTKINTIQFLYPDPFMEAGQRATLEVVAERSGGKFRFVDARELGLE